MAQVHPKTDPQTAQETGVTARLSARDAENAKPHTATNVDVPVKEVHRYRPDFFGDYMYVPCKRHANGTAVIGSVGGPSCVFALNQKVLVSFVSRLFVLVPLP